MTVNLYAVTINSGMGNVSKENKEFDFVRLIMKR